MYYIKIIGRPYLLSLLVLENSNLLVVQSPDRLPHPKPYKIIQARNFQFDITIFLHFFFNFFEIYPLLVGLGSEELGFNGFDELYNHSCRR